MNTSAWRCVQLRCSADNADSVHVAHSGLTTEMSHLHGLKSEVTLISVPSGEEMAAQIRSTQAAYVYIYTDGLSLESEQLPWLHNEEWLQDFAASMSDQEANRSLPNLLYVDAVLPASVVKVLAEAGVQHIVHWSAEQSGSRLIATHFGHAFAVALNNPAATIHEAFALACHACHVHLGTRQSLSEGQCSTALPCFHSTEAATLPVSNTIPLPQVEGMDFSQGVGAAVPDWDDVRLLAPHAELRLLACGQASLIQTHRLSFLGETLRAMLVLEVRQLTVLSQRATQRIPAHLPSGCTAICCQIQTASKAQAQVVLGGPHQVLQNPVLVEHALRQTLAADALSLQFKLPAPGVAPAMAHASASIACGTAVIDALAVTSVWVVQVLRALCADRSNRMLPALGIAAVGCTSSTAFTQADAERYTALSHLTSSVPESLDPILLPQSRPQPAPLAPISHNTLPLQQQPLAGALQAERQRSGSLAAAAHSSGSRGRPAKEPKLMVPDASVVSWTSDRPELATCNPQQLLEDMRKFLEARRGKQLQASTFPEAILNGAQLDLNALYRTVCSRGGFAMGTGVNWAGQVFPRMANYTNTHKMTGVGNALKRHYQALCLDYELAHPQDLTKQ